MHEVLLDLISRQVKPSANDIDLCNKYFEPVSYPKSKIIEPQGKVPRYLYFIVSGFVRLFHFGENGAEFTTNINCPPGFITSYTDFANQTITNDNLECITECALLRISKQHLDLLIKESGVFNAFSIWVFQQSMAYKESRTKELVTLSAAQRYENLIQNHPAILQNVPVQYIASFLGMKAESLSRIRRQLIN